MKANRSYQQKLIPRWLALFLVSGLLLAACNPAPPDSTRPPVESPAATLTARPTATRSEPTARPSRTPTPADQLEVDPQDLKDLHINFWHAWDSAAGDEVEALVEQFNRQNEWGIEVEAIYLDGYDDMFEQVSAALEDEAQPDVAVSYLYHAQTWDADGDVTDLSVFVEDPTWGWNPNGPVDYYPVFWEHDLINGKRLGVPAQRSGQILFYNATWARSLGFNAAPRTPEEFAEQACAAASANQEDDDPGE